MSRTVTWDDWSFGEWDRLGAFNAPRGAWSGVNMVLCQDGSVAPRKGRRELTVAGIPNGHKLLGAGYNRLADHVWVSVVDGGGTIRTWDVTFSGLASPSIVQYGGSAPGGNYSAPGQYYAEVDDRAFMCIGNYLWVLDHPNQNMFRVDSVSVPTPPPILGYQTVCLFGRQLFASAGNQIVYSNPNDFGVWPAANIETVGDRTPVTHMLAYRDRLLIFKANSVYQLTGYANAGFGNLQLRQLVSARGTLGYPYRNRRYVEVAADQRMWGVFGVDVFPSAFDGLTVSEVRRLRIVDGAGATGNEVWPTLLPSAGDIAFTNRNAVLMRRNGAWSRQVYPATGAANDQARRATAIAGTPAGVTTAHLREGAFVQFEYDTSGNVRWWSQDTLDDRPGLEGFPDQRAGDGTAAQLAGSLTLPQLVAPAGHEVQPKKVTVDLRKTNTGGSLTNHCDVAVTVTDRAGQTDGPRTSTAARAFDEAGGVVGVVGAQADHRLVVNVGEQGVGGAVQVALANIRGCAVKRVTLTYDEIDERA